MSENFTVYGNNKTNLWQEILAPSTLAFSCEVVHHQTMKICLYS